MRETHAAAVPLLGSGAEHAAIVEAMSPPPTSGALHVIGTALPPIVPGEEEEECRHAAFRPRLDQRGGSLSISL